VKNCSHRSNVRRLQRTIARVKVGFTFVEVLSPSAKESTIWKEDGQPSGERCGERY
jgi:hypothetical protein